MIKDRFKEAQELDKRKRDELLPEKLVEEIIAPTGRFGFWEPKNCTHIEVEKFVTKNGIEIHWCKTCGALGIEELTNFDTSHNTGEKIMGWEVPFCNRG